MLKLQIKSNIDFIIILINLNLFKTLIFFKKKSINTIITYSF
jgi:hypothetical protein